MDLPQLTSIEDTPLPVNRRYFDAHVHPWPARLYSAILAWFDANAWRIAERFDAGGVDDFLTARGVTRYSALVYAHKAGMARGLNAWLADWAKARPKANPLGTVHPADDVAQVVEEALGPLGLRGLKLHAHVMGFPADDSRLFPAYEILCRERLPVVFHAGTQPESEAYPRPCRDVSGLARLGRVLSRFPELRCLIPHLGADEFGLAAELLRKYPNTRLDTAMVLARYFPKAPDRGWVAEHQDRILYGTDFPILPYPYDRERRCILSMNLGARAEEAIFWGNAAEFFGVADVPPASSPI